MTTLITAPGDTLLDAWPDLIRIADTHRRAELEGYGTLVIRRNDRSVVACMVDTELPYGVIRSTRLESIGLSR